MGPPLFSRLPCPLVRENEIETLPGLYVLLLLGLALVLARPAGAVGESGVDAVPDTTHSVSVASAFDPEAGRLLRWYVGPDTYAANAQNWDATQDTSGILYVGNSDGVLVYDGHSWRTIPVSNRSVVRSVASDDRGRVFVGAQGEIGVLRPDSLGRMQYVSLLDHVPEEHQSFADVYGTLVTDDHVYFQSEQRLFRWTPAADTMHSWAGTGAFQVAGTAHDSLFVNVSGRGLVTVQDDSLRLVPGGERFADRRVAFVVPHAERGVLVGTSQGLFVREGDAFRSFSTGADALLRSAFVYEGETLPDGTIAVATIDRGLLLLSPEGRVQRRLEARGNPVTGLHGDQEGGLLAVLDGGLLRYDVGGPFTVHSAATGVEGAITGVERHRGELYVTTIQGTYRLPARSDTLSAFVQIPELALESWVPFSAGEDLLVGTSRGLARRAPDGTVRFLPEEGPKVYELLRSRVDSSRLYAATEQGIRIVRETESGWRMGGRLSGLRTQARSVAEAEDGTLWIGTAYDGLYRVRFAESVDSTIVDHFGSEHGLTSNSVAPYHWQGRVVFGVSTGILRFASAPEPHFEPLRSVEIPRREQGLAVVRVQEGAAGVTWGYGPFGPGRWVRRDTTWTWAPGALHRFWGMNVGVFEVEEKGETIWMGTNKGRLTRYVPKTKWPRSSPPTLVRRVYSHDADSLIAANGTSGSSPKLAYAHNSLRLTYGVPSLVAPEKVEYQYRLAGKSSEWSDWTGRTEQLYRTLAPGEYTFAVRARLAYGDTTEAARYSFTILPPWYRTWWAYGGYLLLALGLVAGAVRWRTWQLRRRQEELEATVAERTREIEHQKEQLAEQAERLEELDEAKTRFFANVSHEFRTPLTLILGPVRDLRERVRRHLSEEDAEQLGVVERNAHRLLRLVEQILGIARMEAGTYELDARPTDLGAEVQRIARTFEPMAERADLSLIVETGEEERASDAEPVYVDREALEHVLSNLLSNAIKFTPAGGRITVSVAETAEAVEVVVADTGPGIPAAEQEAVFNRFEQVDDTKTRAQEGAGIGLAFVADLVDLHGGSVDLDSTEGEGTTVTVRFPRGTGPLADEQLADGAEAPDKPTDGVPTPTRSPEETGRAGTERSETNGAPTAPPASPAGTTAEADDPDEETDRKRVLVVDDNGEVRRYVRSILEPEFAVLEAADGADGVEAAREHLPDVILADVMMPAVDGHEMTQHLKQDPETEAIPVIMVTARAGTEDEVEGLRVGADDYVTKPFDADVLRQRVEGVVALQQRLRDRLRAELQDESGTDGDEAPEERPEVERTARQVIREHLTESDFGVDDLAREMARSRSALYDAFNEQTDTTPAALITQVRMERATDLLREDEGSVTQVAYAVGYESLSSFSRAFRKHTGQSPSAVTAEA